MKKYNMLVPNRILFVTIFLFLVACTKNTSDKARVASLPFFEDASFTPKWIADNNKKLKGFHKIRNFNLTNQHGIEVTQQTFENKIYVADFFFTSCPGICPMMTDSMLKLQEVFKNDNDILFLSHSVTPTIDSVAKLKNYAEEHGVGNKWHLVTGDKKQIYDLGRNFYFVEENLGETKGINDFLHTENFVLIDKNKHIRGIYNSLNRASLAQLIIDIKALKNK
jgi:protein SCO1/2